MKLVCNKHPCFPSQFFLDAPFEYLEGRGSSPSIAEIRDVFPSPVAPTIATKLPTGSPASSGGFANDPQFNWEEAPGFRSTVKRESDVKALEGVKSPPSNVKTPNEITATRTGRLFSTNEIKHIGNENKVDCYGLITKTNLAEQRTDVQIENRAAKQNATDTDLGYKSFTERMRLSFTVSPTKT
ncbi:hypothetical protein LXL04_034451 [Taraxacum kok-saghyz]